MVNIEAVSNMPQYIDDRGGSVDNGHHERRITILSDIHIYTLQI